jgi:Immunity protein 49
VKPNFAPVALKNAGVELEEIIGVVCSPPYRVENFAHVCRLYRRIATGILLVSSDPRDFYRYLFNSSRAFVYFSEQADEQSKVTSKATAYFDAVACRDREGERRLAAASRHTLNPGLEYEEDFAYVSILMRRFSLDAPMQALEGILDEWEGFVAGNPDPRFAVVKALVSADQAGFDDAMKAAVKQLVKARDAALEAERIHPDEASTSSRINVEVLAWIELAERAGLRVKREYPLAPSAARLFHRIDFPPPDDWQHPTGFATL